jgi:putative inorganic carbon (HCO3(-)) transporter
VESQANSTSVEKLPRRGRSAAGRFVVVPLAAAAPLLGGLAAAVPAFALLGLVGALFSAVALSQLAAGIASFTFLTFFERLENLGSSGISFVKLAGGALACSWILHALAPGGVRFLLRSHPVLGLGATLLPAWALVSTLWAVDVGWAAREAGRYALVVGLVLIVFSGIREAKHVRWVLWAYLAGAAVTVLAGLAYGPPPEAAESYTGRLSGGISDPNELAATIVPAFAFSAFAACSTTGAMRWLAGACTGFFSIALFLTGSRGGLVGLAVVLLAGLVLAGRARRQFAAITAIVVLVGIFYYAFAAPPNARARITEFTAGGGTGRADIWSIGTEMVADHPLIGVGAGNFRSIEPRYFSETLNLPNSAFVVDGSPVAHNTYLEVMAELGIVGFFIFGAVVVGALVQAWRAVTSLGHSDDRGMEFAARGLIVGILGMLAAFAFISAPYDKQLWLLLGLALAVPLTSRSEPGSRATGTD